jgi:hypothetical protein
MLCALQIMHIPEKNEISWALLFSLMPRCIPKGMYVKVALQ